MANVLILGGNRFFGKRLAKSLVTLGHSVTLGNRQNLDDGLANQVKRLKLDRDSVESMKSAIGTQKFDLVFDQIAYLDTHAQGAIEVFTGKVGRYIATSTMSVYSEWGADLSESAFDPYSFDIAAHPHSAVNPQNRSAYYLRGKQLMEATFFQKAKFQTVAPRFSFVLGADDHTQRLKFHVDRVREQKPIYFPNPNVMVSMIDSQDAADALLHLAMNAEPGAYNVAAPEPIVLSRMMNLVEERVHQKAVITEQASESAGSPYAVAKDWYLDCSKLADLGFKARSIESWMPELISNLR